MTRKPRNTYTDNTRAARCARRNAILNAAAERMGFTSWSSFESEIRADLEGAASDNGAALRLQGTLSYAYDKVEGGPENMPPADMQAINARYPKQKPAHVAGVRGSVSTREGKKE